MRQIMADTARSTAPAIVPDDDAGHRVPSQDHRLLGRPAPALVLEGRLGQDLGPARRELADGPVVVVFYLGSTCVACVTHLVELDVAMPRFRERGARVLAVSGDAPEFSLRTDAQVRWFSDPAPERSRPRGLHGLRRLEDRSRAGIGRRRSPARHLHHRP